MNSNQTNKYSFFEKETVTKKKKLQSTRKIWFSNIIIVYNNLYYRNLGLIKEFVFREKYIFFI